jgi:hypothetical protein
MPFGRKIKLAGVKRNYVRKVEKAEKTKKENEKGKAKKSRKREALKRRKENDKDLCNLKLRGKRRRW